MKIFITIAILISTILPCRAVATQIEISLVPILKLVGDIGSTNVVEYTTNLSRPHWFVLTNVVIMQNPSYFIDMSGERARFYRILQEDTNASRMAWVPSGSFLMGSPAGEYGHNANESPQTMVTLDGFWMCRYEVTQEEYEGITGSNPSSGAIRPDYPMNCVSWNDANNYCILLTAMERAAGRLPAGYTYRLPTEAEWEYACRAGTTNAFYFGDIGTGTNHYYYTNYAWVLENSDYSTHPVGQKIPNDWGLYDMCGNVWEWCADAYGTNYPGGSVTNYYVPCAGQSLPSLRGGSYLNGASSIRSANRSYDWDRQVAGAWGFRVVLAKPLPSAK